jgi:hypothetical protein
METFTGSSRGKRAKATRVLANPADQAKKVFDILILLHQFIRIR